MNDPATLIAQLDDDALEGLVGALAPRLADALVPQLVDAVRELVADQLRAPASTTPALLTAAQKAQELGVSIDYVYRHADEFGAIRLPSGNGERQSSRGGRRLRFNPQRGEPALTPSVEGNGSGPAEAPPPAAKPPRRRRAGRGGADRVPHLLPIRGREE